MSGEVSPTAAEFLAGLGEPFADLDRAIHPGDAMARFAERLCRGVREVARLEYFRTGHAGFRAVEQVLQWRFGDLSADAPRSPHDFALLDFGCGHGRVTRFLARALGPERVVAAEIDETAGEFVRRFGVRTVASPSDPAQFAGADFPEAGDFDAIVALSVLTHLPESAFHGWLARWWRLLAPGGVLVASVLDERVLLPGRELPASGFHFERMSESEVLDLDDYGTAWTDERFVRSAIGRLARDTGEAPARVERLPLGLWHLQDLWVLVKPSLALDLPPLTEHFDPGPAGWLEACKLSADRRRLEVRGWAIATSGRATGRSTEPARIVVGLGGEVGGEIGGELGAGVVIEGACDGRRDDLPEIYGERAAAGFRIVHEASEPLAPSTPLRVVAVDPRTGSERVLHLGSVEATDLYLRLVEARAEADRLADEVAVFEASGFGRLRRRWMAWKRRRSRV